MTKHQTLAELKASEKDFFTPSDIAGVLKINPYTINIMARDCPEQLGFPVLKIGSRVKIPKIPFLKVMGVEI